MVMRCGSVWVRRFSGDRDRDKTETEKGEEGGGRGKRKRGTVKGVVTVHNKTRCMWWRGN